MTEPDQRISTAFVGLGSQGGPMARRMLDSGYPMMVWTRRPEASLPWSSAGAAVASSVAELGARADHVGVCVVDDAGALEVCAELLPSMKPGSLLAIHSTISPGNCEQLARECARLGIAFIDAPVSGGGDAAAAGKLTVMCGGTPEAFDQARRVFETFAGTLVLLGPAGSGQRAKIVNNALMAANMGMAHAALGVAEAIGIDRSALASLIRESSGRSFGFEVFARLPSPSAFTHGAPLLVKDVNLLSTIAAGHDGGDRLRAAAERFLTEATGEPL